MMIIKETIINTLFFVVLILPIQANSEDQLSVYGNILSNIMPALKNPVASKISLSKVKELLSQTANTPNNKVFEQEDFQYHNDGFIMYANNGAEVFRWYFTSKNGYVESSHYVTALTKPLSAVKSIFNEHKNFLDNNYNLIKVLYENKGIKRLVVNNIYDIGDNCEADMKLIKGTFENLNDDVGKIYINVKCFNN